MANRSPIDVQSANGALIDRGTFDSVSVDPTNAVFRGWTAEAQGVTVDGFYYTCPNPNHMTNTFDAAGRLITHSYSVYLDNSCGENQDSTSTLGTHTWTYDADNHTTERYGDTACIAWGPNDHAMANRCAAAGVDSLHYDGDAILFVTNSSGNLTDIRLDTLGDLELTPIGNVFRVEDRDLAGLAVTAHSNRGSDSIELGSQSAWTTTVCPPGNSIVDPPPTLFCHPVYGGHNVVPTVGGFGSPEGAPSYEQKQIDGVKWSDDVTLQGARAKASATGTWTTPDVYAGDVDDPISQKPFIWNRNNPYEYSDPNGFCPGASSMQVIGTNGASETIQSIGCVDARPVAPKDQLMADGRSVGQVVADHTAFTETLAMAMSFVLPGGAEAKGINLAAESGAALQATGRITYLYQKISATGEHLKYGITFDLAGRYSPAELAGGRLKTLASGSRSEMLKLERNLHRMLPIGAEEKQTFYRVIQQAMGYRLPPY